MLEIFPQDALLQINEDDTTTATQPDFDTEDIYFSWACEYLRLKIPDPFHRSFLSIEADMNTETCVFHGWQHTYHVGKPTVRGRFAPP
jgi:hypothetical protein